MMERGQIIVLPLMTGFYNVFQNNPKGRDPAFIMFGPISTPSGVSIAWDPESLHQSQAPSSV